MQLPFDNPIISFRKIALFASLLLIAACGGGSSDSGGAVAQENPTPDPAPVVRTRSAVAIGDSIGNGFGLAMPWPPRVGNQLGIPVFNNSRSGEETDFGVAVIGDLIEEHNPTHVIILLGTNDAIRGSVSNAMSNLQQMVNIARNRDVIPIVATLPIITRDRGWDARAAQISNGIRNLNNAVVADVRPALGRSQLADGIHPNNEGQQVIANTIVGRF